MRDEMIELIDDLYLSFIVATRKGCFDPEEVVYFQKKFEGLVQLVRQLPVIKNDSVHNTNLSK